MDWIDFIIRLSLTFDKSHYRVSVCVDLNASCLFYPALERPEGVSQQDNIAMEEFQQHINAVSLEKVKAYYRRLRYTASQPSSGLLMSTVDTFHLKVRVHPVVVHNQAETAVLLLSVFKVVMVSLIQKYS